MAAKFYGNHGTNCIVSGIHEMDGPHCGILKAQHPVQEEFRVFHASVIRSRDDGIGTLDLGLLKRLYGAPESPFEEPSHAASLHGRNNLPEVRVFLPKGHYG